MGVTIGVSGDGSVTMDSRRVLESRAVPEVSGVTHGTGGFWSYARGGAGSVPSSSGGESGDGSVTMGVVAMGVTMGVSGDGSVAMGGVTRWE